MEIKIKTILIFLLILYIFMCVEKPEDNYLEV